MSRESKILSPRVWGTQETISHYEAFGWELLSINGQQITMSRETQNPVYSDLVKIQAAYEDKVEELGRLLPPTKPKKPPRISFSTCFWTFICLVLPFAIYITCKILQKKKYNEAMIEYNAQYKEYEEKKKAIIAQMNDIILQGRTTFFSRQA